MAKALPALDPDAAKEVRRIRGALWPRAARVVPSSLSPHVCVAVCSMGTCRSTMAAS